MLKNIETRGKTTKSDTNMTTTTKSKDRKGLEDTFWVLFIVLCLCFTALLAGKNPEGMLSKFSCLQYLVK